MNPAAYSAGQNRFPGRAKWYPVAAEYSPGLMPANSTRSPGAATSGIVLSLAAMQTPGTTGGGYRNRLAPHSAQATAAADGFR